MAKKQKQVEAEDQVQDGEAAEATPSKGRAVMITDPETGEPVARKDVIKEAYEGGMSRSDIRKMLEEKYNHNVAYQIVFAATKNLKAPEKAAE